MSDPRIVEVDRDWYVKLKEYLQPVERWAKELPDGRTATVLHSACFETGETHELDFVPKVSNV